MRAALLFCFVSSVWLPGQVSAQKFTEYEVKAAFLYNFARYIQWPTSEVLDSTVPVVIGVLGRDPFGKTLDKTAEGRKVEKREIRIRRFRNLDEPEPCHILFTDLS